MADRRDGRDPFANLDSSKLVSLDGKEERPPPKRSNVASEGQFAPLQDEAVLELDVVPPRRGATAPQPRPTGPLPPPSRTTGPLPPLPRTTGPLPPLPRTTGPISAPPPAPRTTIPLPPLPVTSVAPAPPNPRVVFVVGMALALAVAFLPAHFYASMAEHSYDTIRLEATHTEPAVNQAVYQAELEEREAAIGRLGRAKSRVGAITAMIWLAGAGGLGYAWLRLVQSRLPDDA